MEPAKATTATPGAPPAFVNSLEAQIKTLNKKEVAICNLFCAIQENEDKVYGTALQITSELMDLKRELKLLQARIKLQCDEDLKNLFNTTLTVERQTATAYLSKLFPSYASEFDKECTAELYRLSNKFIKTWNKFYFY